MKRILSALLCVAMLVTMLSACQQEHVHTFDKNWQYDADDHWHQATCEHVDEVADKASHEDEDSNGICDVCGCSLDHAHTHEAGWTQGKDTHYHKPTCGCADDSKYRKDEAAHEDKNNDGLCDVCAYNYGHEHTYEEKWTAAEGGHWHLPSCGHDVPGSQLTAHADEDNNGLCDACGDSGGHEHTYATEWSSDENGHWHAPNCGHDVDPADKGAHVNNDADMICDVCGKSVEHFHSFDTKWSADKNKHWHAAICEHTEQRNDEADHVGYEEDGICDTCDYVVFHWYKVNVTIPSFISIADADGNIQAAPFTVKEGETLVFYLAVPTNVRLERVDNAVADMLNPMGPVTVGNEEAYLYKIEVTPTGDTKVNAVANKLSGAKTIVEVKGAVIKIEKALKPGYLDISFTAPEDGKYAIYGANANADVNFGDKSTTEFFGKFSHEVNLKAGQTVTFRARNDGWGPSQVTFDYWIVKLEDQFVLPYLQGEGYTMPSTLPVTVTFTLPEPGLYLFTTKLGELTWLIEGEPNGTVEPQFFQATKANQSFTITFRKVLENAATYEFDWDIVQLKPQAELASGTNKIHVDIGAYTAYSFTASKPGNYYFECASDRFVLNSYYDFWGNGHKGIYSFAGEQTLKAGETVLLLISSNANVQTPPTEPFDDQLTISYLGYSPEYDKDGNPIMIPNVDTTFVASEAGDYTFTMPDKTQISFDGGKTWQSGIVEKYVDGSIKYRVRNSNGSNNSITLVIKRVEYKFTVNAGTAATTVTMVPGKDYTVSLSSAGDAMVKDFVLSWTDANIVVSYMGQTLQSPAELTGFQTWGGVTIRYNGTADAQISFMLTDNTVYEDQVPSGDVLVLGENHIVTTYSNETVYTFTATEAGTYVLSNAAGENNFYVVVNEKDVYSSPDALRAELTLAAGETATFIICTNVEGQDTVDLVLEKKA